ncbi:MAG: hypothetical protein ACD_73C00600G0001, partial [uncultured bacterium]
QIINGSMTVKKQFSYTLIPQEKGTFTIPPIDVTVDGRAYKSNPVAVVIGDSGHVRPHQSPGINQNPFTQGIPQIPGGIPDQRPNNLDRENDVPYWIETNISKKNPFLNEQVIFAFRFYTSVNVGTASLTLPAFKDFSVEELVPEKKGYQTINGKRYVVSEKILALFPLKAGKINIEDTSLRVEVPDESANPFNDPFFFGMGRTRLKVKNLKSKGMQIDVKQLPTENQTDHFTGLVGHFDLETKSDPKEVLQGDSVSYQITLKGRGNIKEAVLPPFNFSPNIKVYDDNPTVNLVRKESGVEGEKIFKKALVPTQSGSFEIPEGVVSYFDPDKQQYIDLNLAKQIISVKPVQSENLSIAKGMPVDQTMNKNQVQAPETNGLLPLAPVLGSNLFENIGAEIVQLSIIFYLIPPFLFLGLFLFKRGSFKRNKNSRVLAFQKFKNKLRKIPVGEGWAIKIEKSLKDYFEHRFKLVGHALTPIEMAALFEQNGVGKDLILRFIQMMNVLQSLIYNQTGKQEVTFNLQEFCELLEVMNQKIKI